ncbi:MAG: hypothetical protein E7183_05560 [Erysipelotrichaceae bacterium]|nr:hypothetical protein [Erysipelotrichaceae bacterium]
MIKNKKHKELIRQIKETKKCTVTPQDIYSNTDFFDNNYSKKKTSYKLAFITSLVIVFISITCISILGVQNYKLSTKEPEIVYIDNIKYMIDDSNGMPMEEKNFIKEELDYFNVNPICMYSHDKDTLFYIYYGYNISDEGLYSHYYYYAFKLDFEFKRNITLLVNDNTIAISDDNRYGLLTIIDESKTDDLTVEFIVKSENKTKKYLLDASNY